MMLHDIQEHMGDVLERRCPLLYEQFMAVFGILETEAFRSSVLPVLTYLNSGALLLISELGFGFKPSWDIISPETHQLWACLLEQQRLLSDVPWIPNPYVDLDEYRQFAAVEELLLTVEATVCACSAYLSRDNRDLPALMAFFLQQPRHLRPMAAVVQQILSDVVIFQCNNPEFDFTKIVAELTGHDFSAAEQVATSEDAGSHMFRWSKSRYLSLAGKLKAMMGTQGLGDENDLHCREIYRHLRRHSWCEVWGPDVDVVAATDFIEPEFADLLVKRSAKDLYKLSEDILMHMIDPNASHLSLKRSFHLSDLSSIMIADPESIMGFVHVQSTGENKNAKKKKKKKCKQEKTAPSSSPTVSVKSSTEATQLNEVKQTRKVIAREKRQAEFLANIPQSGQPTFPGISDEEVQLLAKAADSMQAGEFETDGSKARVCFQNACHIYEEILQRWTQRHEMAEDSEHWLQLRIALAVSVLWDDEAALSKNRAMQENLQRLTVPESLASCFPAFEVIMVKLHLARKAFLKAEPHLVAVKQIVDSGAEFEYLKYPCTDTQMMFFTRAGLIRQIEDMETSMETHDGIDHVCMLSDCRIPVISYNLDFTGYSVLCCTEQCELAYHHDCLLLALSRLGIDEIRNLREDKDYGCPTPDCAGAISLVNIYTKEKKLKTSFQRPSRPVCVPERRNRDDASESSSIMTVAARRRALFDSKHKIYGCKVPPEKLWLDVQGKLRQGHVSQAASESDPVCGKSPSGATKPKIKAKLRKNRP